MSPSTSLPSHSKPIAARRSGPPRTPVAIVIPCYNEEEALPNLARALGKLRRLLRQRYSPSFILVDDGSTDRTPEVMQQLFSSQPDCEVLRMEQNQGIAGAVLEGIRRARAEIVCTIDSDCSYDPCDLVPMIALLSGEVGVVTASPYHPRGKVLDVPQWRLHLSRSASALYRLILHQRLATYTSCFRVYRRNCVVNLRITDHRFAGIAEILGRLDLQGATIVEHPATLRSRCHGQSKMKLFRTILSQLIVLSRLAALRCFGPDKPQPSDFLKIEQGHSHATDH